MGALAAYAARKWPAPVRLTLPEIVSLQLAAQPSRRHDPDLQAARRKLDAARRRRQRAVARAAR